MTFHLKSFRVLNIHFKILKREYVLGEWICHIDTSGFGMEWLEELHAMTQVLGSNYFRMIMWQVGGGFSGLKHDFLLFWLIFGFLENIITTGSCYQPAVITYYHCRFPTGSDDHVITVNTSLPRAKTDNDRGFTTSCDDVSVVVWVRACY
jgi:hypothetical protein